MTRDPKDTMSDDRDEREQSEFKVMDRRKFTPEGELRPQAEAAAPSENKPSEKRKPDDPAARPPRSRPEPSSAAAAMDFSSFILSLATSGMVHLGEVPDPVTGRRADNLEAARQMIDLLTMLQKKTKGNLAPEEAVLLENLLYELRMKFLAQAKVVKF